MLAIWLILKRHNHHRDVINSVLGNNKPLSLLQSNMSANIPAPESIPQLQQRYQAIAGQTLAEIASYMQWPVPPDLKRNKGWVGQLLEARLGASAGSLSEPDFQQLGIEMKTLPLNKQGKPKESTYVCMVPLNNVGESWEQSWVRRKLAHVLWLPLEADNTIPLPQRRIGNAILWQPDAGELAILQQDWEELMEMISMGNLDRMSAKIGRYLQIRPKAADSHIRTGVIDENGAKSQTQPRGFYLRSRFTKTILENNYLRVGQQ